MKRKRIGFSAVIKSISCAFAQLNKDKRRRTSHLHTAHSQPLSPLSLILKQFKAWRIIMSKYRFCFKK